MYEKLVVIQEPLRVAAPSSDVTFLFSDIEGSTARWKMYPEAMPRCLRRHDDLMRAAIEQHDGKVFKTVGDEFCAAFAIADDALAAAVYAQSALASEDWNEVGGLRVRMAIHRGPANPRDDDYFGTTVNRVARLLSAGHGGQILLSAAAAAALDSRTAGALIDLGRHRLKDFPELESIYQAGAPELTRTFPPLRTIAERPTNLPRHAAQLFGRETDLAGVLERINSGRLLSLVGAGGVGKTALALQAGSDLVQAFEDGVWLVELAPVDADAVVPALASVFGITVASHGTLLDALTAHLATKNALLIVDNCEHVSAAALDAIDVVLNRCAGIRVLATSREPLGSRGEIVYRLPALAVPPPSAVTAAQVRAYGACQLFEERARAHVAAFQIDDGTAACVAAICRRLDGIALAIELAAPRLRMMSLGQLAERLAQRFRLLTGGNRNVLPHHQTLRALIDWSYELLCENERTLLRRSALFPGGWSIGAAVDVCTDERLEEWDVLEHLASLVDKSLVVLDQHEDEPRYRMLESTREYALERLDESGERDAISQKQASYFLHLAERADTAWSDVPARAWIAPLNAELDNFRAALTWCVAQEHAPSLGLRLFGALEAFWWDAQPMEGRRWLDRLEPIVQREERASTARYWLTAAGIDLSTAHEKAALQAAEKALAIYSASGDTAGIAAAQRCRGASLMRLGKMEDGARAIREALEVFRANGHRRLSALALRTLATAHAMHGEMELAAQLYREALPLSQVLEDERGIGIIASNLAEIEALSENYEQAIAHGTEALAAARSRQDSILICTLLINITAYFLALDRYAEARLTAREGLDIAAELESSFHVTVAIQHLACIAASCGDAQRAARLIGFVDASYEQLENPREESEAREYERTLQRLLERLTADDLTMQRRTGAAFTNSDARREALLI